MPRPPSGPSPCAVRLLYVSHSFPLRGQPLSNVGGMQRVATGLHAALARRPDVQLSSLLLETTWEATPYRVPGFLAGLLVAIPRALARGDVDAVLFSSMVTAGLSPALAGPARRAGALLAAIPVGRDVTLPTPIHQWWVPRAFRALGAVFPISPAVEAECLARGLDAAKTQVVPCGVDPALFAAPLDRAAARRDLLGSLGAAAGDVPEGALLLVAVGRHQERKGFGWFVEHVMPRLPPDARLLLGGEGPMTPAIREAIARGGLEDRVRLLGRVSEETLRALYRGGDLFVMPNVPVAGDIEGFGVVMLEAGLCGLPVVAADLEGISDVVTEGVNGHLVPSRDAAAFAAAILRYRGHADRLAAASASASAHTARAFSWDAVAGRLVDELRVRGTGARRTETRGAGARRAGGEAA